MALPRNGIIIKKFFTVRLTKERKERRILKKFEKNSIEDLIKIKNRLYSQFFWNLPR